MTEVEQRKLVKDVTKRVNQRGRRRRLVLLVLLLAAVIAAALFLTCHKGWGFAGKSRLAGDTAGSAAVARDAAPRRCAIRVGPAGLTLDGQPTTRPEAVAACKATGGAEVLVTGDARQGDWDDLRAALDAAGIPYLTREPRGLAPGDAAVPR